MELKEKQLKYGYLFYSQTDTEVVIKMIDHIEIEDINNFET